MFQLSEHLKLLMSLASAASAFCFALSTYASTELDNELESKVDQVTADNNIPAVSVGVIKNDKAYFHSSGLTHRVSGLAVTENTPFQIASVSKLFTGLIVNQLVHDRIIDAELPLSTYFENILSKDASRKFEQFALNDILHHHSGITDELCSIYRLRVENEPWLDGYSRDQLIEDIEHAAAMQTTERGFLYSNCGYAIVALVSEVVTGQRYSELLKNLVANYPLMKNTHAAYSEVVAEGLAQAYKKTDRTKETQASSMGIATAASAVVSSAADLLALQAEHIKAYREFSISGKTTPLILTASTDSGPEETIRYGYGLMAIQHPLGTLYGHDGDADGYAAFYVFSPQHDTGVVLLTSSGGDWVAGLALELLALAANH